MTTTPTDLAPDRTLAELATHHAGASRVFHRHRLDFCCHGQVRLDEACARRGLDLALLLDELRAAQATPLPSTDWDREPATELLAHILERFHAGHRAELPRLLEMARKVESVHADKASCPRGLAAHVERIALELEQHMQKEEQVLFPLIQAGRGRMAAMPIQIMELEHLDHANNLARLRELAHDFRAPQEACNTWRALYLGLAELERELMEHIHLENNVLFPNAVRS